MRPTRSPPFCPAECASVSGWRGRLPSSPRCCCWTSRLPQIDALTRGVIQQELMKMWEATGTTVFMVTHDVDEAILLSDRVALMSTGPAARVAECLDVRIPRPRRRETIIDLPEYTQLRNEVLHFLMQAT